MTKQVISISVDPEVITKFKTLYPNRVSEFCNDQMRLRINSNLSVPGALELQIIETKKRDVENQLSTLNSDLLNYNDKINNIRAELKKAEAEQAQRVKEEAQKIKTCYLCKNMIENPKFIVNFKPGVIICKTCYDPSNPRFIALTKEE